MSRPATSSFRHRGSPIIRALHLLILLSLLAGPAAPLRAEPAGVTTTPRTLTRADFSTPGWPTGWTATKVGTSKVWSVGTGTITAGSGVIGAHARADNTARPSPAMNTTLTLPTINLTSVVSPVLAFNSDFLSIAGSTGNIDLSVNGGVNWTTLVTYTANTQGLQRLALPAAAGNANARLRFRYRASASLATTATATANKKRWRIDNIEVVDLPVPSAPTGLAAAGQVGSVAVSWTDASSSESGFRVERSLDGSSWTVLTTTLANATGYTDSGANPARSYQYRVQALNFSGASALAAVTFTPAAPAPPSGLLLTPGQRHVVMSWTDNSTNETGYEIQRRPTAGSWVVLTTTAAGVSAYTDATAAAGTDYSYAVRAVNEGPKASDFEFGDTTTLALTAPAAPSGLSATVGVTHTVLSWTDGGFTEDGFRIERTDNGGLYWTTVITTAENITSYTDSGLTAAWPYSYRLRAVNSAGESAAATTAVTTAAPLVLQGFSGTALPSGWASTATTGTKKWTVGSTGLTITAGSGVVGANARADNTAASSPAMNAVLTLPTLNLTGVVSPVLTFNSDFKTVTGSTGTVELSLNAGSSWTPVFTATPTVTNAVVALPTAVGQADVRIRLRYVASANTTANASKRWLVDNLLVTNEPVPAAPIELAADADDESVALSWTDASLNETGFRVERSPNGSSWTVLTTITSRVTGYGDSGLSASTTYHYRVSGVNRSGVGVGATLQITTSAVVPPTAPIDFSAEPAVTSVALSWTDTSGTEDGFLLQRSLDGSSWITVTTTAADVTEYTVTGLNAETLYYFRLAAVRQGVASDAVSLQVTTEEAPPFSFSENFNVTPTGWTITGPTTARWKFSTSAGGIPDGLENMTGNSDGFVAINSDAFPGVTIDTALTSPAIDMSSVSAARLRFKHHFKQYSQSKGAVEISSNGGSSWTRLLLVTATITQTQSIDISSYAGNSDVRVRFRYYDATWEYWWMIDDLSIEVIQPPAQPMNLGAALGTLGTVVLSWDGDGNATSHTIERKLTTDANWTTLTDAAPSATTYTDDSASLLSNTSYNYRVTAVNGAGVSAASDSVSVTTGERNIRAVNLSVSYYDTRANTVAKVTAIEDNIRYLADAIYEMSNGANRVGTVTISTGGARSGTSIQWIQSCWPNANISGYGSEADGDRIQHCDVFQSVDYMNWPLAGGYTIAHEMGHFFYGVFDEYQGSDPCSSPGSPCNTDIGVPNSVMNSQWQAAYGNLNYLNFSTSRNNTGPTNAQYRMFEASAWDTLARHPSADPVNRGRLYWPELATVAPAGGITPTIELTATGGQAVARSSLNIVWDGGTPGSATVSAFGDGDTVLQLLIDTSAALTAQEFAALKAALRTVVDRAGIGDGLVISAVDTAVREVLPLTIIRSEADRTAALAAIDGMTQSATTTVNLAAGLQAAYATLVTDGAVPQTVQRNVLLIAAGEDVDAAATAAQIVPFSDALVSISVVGLTSRAADLLLPVSDQTGGEWFSADMSGLRNALERTLAVTAPQPRARLVQQTLAGGATLPFIVEAAIGRLEVGALVQVPSGSTPQLQVLAPDGSVTGVSCRALPGGDTRATQLWCFTRVAVGQVGTWQVRAAGSNVGLYDISVDGIARRGESVLGAGVRAIGGRQLSAPEAMVLELQVMGQYAVSGLAITATVTTPAGVTEAVVFRDDGVAPDMLANDGLYRAFYSYAGNGTYRVRADIASTAFSAFSTLGVQFAIGPNGEQRPQQLVPLGYSFQRIAETAVTVSGWQPDDQAEAPTELPADGAVQYGRIETADDVDRFAAVVVPGGEVAVTVTDSYYGSRVAVTVRAADGSWEVSSAQAVRTAYGEVLRLPARAGERVVIEVRGVDGSGFYGLQIGPPQY